MARDGLQLPLFLVDLRDFLQLLPLPYGGDAGLACLLWHHLLVTQWLRVERVVAKFRV